MLEDDVLMFRFLLLYIAAEEVRKAENKEDPVGLGLEQPAEPKRMPQVVSLWRTEQWKIMERLHGMSTQTFFQGDFGGEARKPTTWGGNLPLCLPEPWGGGRPRNVEVQEDHL